TVLVLRSDYRRGVLLTPPTELDRRRPARSRGGPPGVSGLLRSGAVLPGGRLLFSYARGAALVSAFRRLLRTDRSLSLSRHLLDRRWLCTVAGFPAQHWRPHGKRLGEHHW